MSLIVISSRGGGLGDSVIAVNNACLLSKTNDNLLLVPHRKIFQNTHLRDGSERGKRGRRSIECFEFALSLFELGSLKVSMSEWGHKTKRVSKGPQSSYLEHAKPFVRHNQELILLDLCPCTWPFRPESIHPVRKKAEQLGEPVDLHRFANEKGLTATVDLFLRARCFIGTCSGFAHVSHIFGVPCFMFLNGNRPRRLEELHRHNQYTIVSSPDEIVIPSVPSGPNTIGLITGSW